MQSCINYVWFDRPCMFNTLLNGNVLRIIRIKCVISIIRNTRIKQLRLPLLLLLLILRRGCPDHMV